MSVDRAGMTRRQMLACCSTGFGAVALSGLMRPAMAATRAPHFQPKAKHVIFCFMSGGVSQVDSFDPKPRLERDHGKPMPVKVERTQFNQNGNIFASPFEFKRYGESGIPVSSLFPHIGTCADDLCVVRSMTTTVNEHAQGNYFFHSGFPLAGHPSAGAWINYGLGSESENLPGFVVLQSGDATVPLGGVAIYGSGYLPAQFQGSIMKGDQASAVRNIQRLESEATQRNRLDFVRGIDQGFLARLGGNADIEAAVTNYETAFRMQAEVPELCDISDETEATRRLYALDHEHRATAAYGRQCLLARRLVERGVRFVELSCLSQGGDGKGNPWDQHTDLEGGHSSMALQVDQPIAGLLKDLKARGLLDETLVIWGGEFGRTPFHQGSDGRDHNPYGFSMWLAGGGFKGGHIYGATDDLGYHVVENEMTVYDLWATVLRQLGIDHYQLTYRHAGRDFRLTDVHGRVVEDLIV